MKKNLLLLLIVSIISLLAFAQGPPPSACGSYLKRDPADPNKVQVVFKPMNSAYFIGRGITNLKKIVTADAWDASFVLMIPDDDVTAEMTLLQNNIVPGSGASYKVEEKPRMSYTNPDDGKTYSILRFRLRAEGSTNGAFQEITFNAGEETPIVSFSFNNIDQATTPILLFNETFRYTDDLTSFPSVLQDDMNAYLNFVIENPTAYDQDESKTDSPPFLVSTIPTNMLTTAGGSYTGDCDNGAIPPDPTDHPNFFSYQELPPYNSLPVSFGPVTATIANGQLQVHWSTLTETNNDHFIIEASKDGKAFTKLTEVKSQAVNGNSNAELAYNYATPLGAATSVLGALAFLGIGLAGFSTKKKLLLAATTLAVIAFTYSCSKKDMPAADAQQKIWVRIAQVDKDGTTKYSKAVEAVRE